MSAESKPIHLTLSLLANDVPQKHPQVIMRDLGITYEHHTPQSLYDCWWFWNCKNVPETLPGYLTELKISPMDAIGHGLSKEMAERLSGKGESQPIQPCPFCGSTDEPYVLEFEFGDGFKIVCGYCGAMGPDSDDRDEAIMLWNKARRNE